VEGDSVVENEMGLTGTWSESALFMAQFLFGTIQQEGRRKRSSQYPTPRHTIGMKRKTNSMLGKWRPRDRSATQFHRTDAKVGKVKTSPRAGRGISVYTR
jgi:hypothetical protein